MPNPNPNSDSADDHLGFMFLDGKITIPSTHPPRRTLRNRTMSAHEMRQQYANILILSNRCERSESFSAGRDSPGELSGAIRWRRRTMKIISFVCNFSRWRNNTVIIPYVNYNILYLAINQSINRPTDHSIGATIRFLCVCCLRPGQQQKISPTS